MPYALGGAQQCGNQILRFTYVDESGTSQHEPFVVVAGVLVHGDDQLAPVEDHLEEIMRKHIPETDWDTFFFHATDIWGGRNYFRDHNVWPRERRLPILMDLARVPDQFNLPVVFGFHEKAEIERLVPRYNAVDAGAKSILAHTYAFLNMAINVERHMRRLLPDEVTFLTVEDRKEVRKTLKELHAILRRRGAELEYFGVADALPFTKIRDTPHFAGKPECRLLQLADACAFIIRGHLRKSPENPPFYDALWPALSFRIKGEVWPVAQWPLGPLFRFWEE